MAKGFTQGEGIDYNETFSPVSCKDSFRITMALAAHYDLELHQMDVKMAFLKGIYMKTSTWHNRKVLLWTAEKILGAT